MLGSRQVTATSILKAILKYAVSMVLVLVALALLGLAVSPIGRSEGGVVGIAMMLLLSIWCVGLVWFIHFGQRVSARLRRETLVGLGLLLVLWIVGYLNWYRLDIYVAHRNWLSHESEHFVFHYAPDYSHQDEIASYAAVRDTAFEHNCGYLGVSVKGKVDFYVYDDLAGGHAEGWENTIFADHGQSVGHEMTHVIAYHIVCKRQKIRLLDEGIATWLNHATGDVDHHGAAWKYYIREYGLPSLTDLADTKTFRRQRPPPYYPAASFVGYLIENYGVDLFRQLWTANAAYPELYALLEDFGLARYLPFIPGRRVHLAATVRKTYGRQLDELDREWRSWLEQRYAEE